MHPNGVGPVAFFRGTILARLGGATVLAWESWPQSDHHGIGPAWMSL